MKASIERKSTMATAILPPTQIDHLVDQNLDRVLRAAGTGLRNYSMSLTVAKMRAAMREAMCAGHDAATRSVPPNTTTVEVLETLLQEISALGTSDEGGKRVISQETVLDLIRNKLQTGSAG